MKETGRIIQLYENIFNGSPWIDISLLPVLQGITAKQAAARVSVHWNSIWEIVNHIIYWRLNVLKRLQGKIIKTPSHNYFVPVIDTSPIAWKKTLKRLEVSQQNWIDFLKTFQEKDFNKV